MISKADIENLKRFCEGNADEKEEQYIYSLFSKNENNYEFQQYIKAEFYEYLKNHGGEEQNLNYILDRIHCIINSNKGKKGNTVLRNVYRWYSAIAAMLLIPLLIAGGIWFSSQEEESIPIVENQVTNTLFAPLGSRIKFTLPDGTEGWLNSGSSLNYSIPFTNNRNITVLGEAWFDVTHDDSHPFEIFAGNSKLKVLGTRFNLSAYPEENYIEVVLEEGKVEFTVPEHFTEVEMEPNERLIYNDGTIDINYTEAYKYGAWKEGRIVFRGDPMDEVARRIERWYNVDVEIVDEELGNYVFRGTFEDDSLEEVLHFLSMTSPIKYEIIDRELQDDGTVRKKKILLYKIK